MIIRRYSQLLPGFVVPVSLHVFCLVLLCGCGGKGIYKITFNTGENPSTASVEFRQEVFDNVEIWVDETANQQFMSWQSGDEKRSIMAFGDSIVCYLSDAEGNFFFTGENAELLLEEWRLTTSDTGTVLPGATKLHREKCRAMVYGADDFYCAVKYTERFPGLLSFFPGLTGVPLDIEVREGDANIHYTSNEIKKIAEGIPAIGEGYEEAVFDDEILTEDLIHVYGILRDEFSGDSLSYMPITIHRVGMADTLITTNVAGKYSVELPTGKAYTMEFGDGKVVNKTIIFDTRDAVGEGSFDVEMDGKLFNAPAGTDFSFLRDEPMYTVYFDSISMAMTIDMESAKTMADRIRHELDKVKKQ